jgi:hypothetical protein
MILYTVAFAFVLGLMRWRVLVVPPLVIAAVAIDLGIGSGWNFEMWKPFSNPIFVDLVLKLLLANVVACVIGYGVGRLIAFVMGRLARSFRTPLE